MGNFGKPNSISTSKVETKWCKKLRQEVRVWEENAYRRLGARRQRVMTCGNSVAPKSQGAILRTSNEKGKGPRSQIKQRALNLRGRVFLLQPKSGKKIARIGFQMLRVCLKAPLLIPKWQRYAKKIRYCLQKSKLNIESISEIKHRKAS